VANGSIGPICKSLPCRSNTERHFYPQPECFGLSHNSGHKKRAMTGSIPGHGPNSRGLHDIESAYFEAQAKARSDYLAEAEAINGGDDAA
jgi:hypothetical protein